MSLIVTLGFLTFIALFTGIKLAAGQKEPKAKGKVVAVTAITILVLIALILIYLAHDTGNS